MKKIVQTSIIIIIFLYSFNFKTYAVVSDTGTKVYSTITYPWAWSPYLSAGYGYPQGFRFEAGYNFGKVISAAIDVGLKDWWSNNPNQGTFGLMGKIFFPVERNLTPYILIGGGGTIAIFGGSDSYILLALGGIYPVESWLSLRPEAGVDFTSKHISGGGLNIGGSGSGPVIYRDETKFYINVSAEFDVMGLFR